MTRWTPTTTQRGLGAQHQTLRRHKLKTLADGTPCRRCGIARFHPERCPYHPQHPSTCPQRQRHTGRGDCTLCTCDLCALDLGHHIDRVFGGQGPRELEHRKCNRSAGAKLGNKLRARRQHSRRW